MPNISGQEHSKYHDWKEVQDLIFMNMFESNPSEEKKIRELINNFMEEQKNVRETDKRDDDRKSS